MHGGANQFWSTARGVVLWKSCTRSDILFQIGLDHRPLRQGARFQAQSEARCMGGQTSFGRLHVAWFCGKAVLDQISCFRSDLITGRSAKGRGFKRNLRRDAWGGKPVLVDCTWRGFVETLY